MAGETEDLDALAKAKAAFYMMNDPALGANLKLRERIALAQMTRRNAYPKTFGEGLASIGDSLSDAWMARSLDKEDTAAAKSASGYTGPASAATPVAPLPPPQPRVVVPPEQVRPPPAPVPPPDGTPGNTGATTFPPPQQQPPPPLPPPAARAVAPPPPPLPPAETTPAPPFGPGGRFGAAFPGQQSAAQPPSGTPVMAEGNEPSSEEMNAGRNALAQALMQQQAARGGPQPLPTTRAVTPPPAGGEPAIRSAPQPAPVQAMPVQPGAVVGWVPESPTSKPRDRPLVGMSQEEADLTRDLAIKVQRNPYMAQSPAAMRLQTLQRDREARQKDADKVWEAELARDTDQKKQHITARIGQADAIQKYGKGELEQQQIRQGLIDGGGGGSPQTTDPRLLGTPQSPQRSGRAKIDQMPEGGIPELWVKDQQAKAAKDKEALESAKPELKETLNLIGQINAHPAKEASLGTLGGLARLTAPGQGFAALHEQLKGKNLAAIYQKIKGTGPVGEREGENLAKAQAALTLAATKEDYDQGLKTFETTLRGAVERAERKMNQPVTAYQKTPDDPYAPDVGQIGTRGGKTVEYIGGDPSQDSSYKTVRR